MIRFEAAGFSYGSVAGTARALSDVSLVLAPGEMLAVLGANGSGKSTLARLSNGLLKPSGGQVSVDGMDTRDDSLGIQIRTSVGMVFQHPDDQIVATSVEDDVAFGPENLGLDRAEIRRRVDEAIAAVGLTGLERREPHLLSGGQKQRLAIAGALAMRPKYLVLDEPTSMIDSAGKREVAGVLDSIREAGHGVLLITHDMVEAAAADRVAVLSRGMVVFDGRLPDLTRDTEQLAEWGLELPDVAVLAEQLRGAGVPVPPMALTPESVVESLWR